MSLKLNGELDTIPFGDLVQIISNGRKSGTLELTLGARLLRFIFVDGTVTGSWRGRGLPDDQLRDMINEQNLLSSAETKSLELIAVKRSQTFSEALLGMSLVDPGHLEEGLRVRTQQLFAEAMGWKEGAFEFRQTEDEERPPLPTLFKVEQLLLSMFV